LLPRANAAACPQLADFASSSQHVREGQRIGEPEAEIDALQRQAMALGVETSAMPPEVFLGVKWCAASPQNSSNELRAPPEQHLGRGRRAPARAGAPETSR
jgi:hypothetical protein